MITRLILASLLLWLTPGRTRAQQGLVGTYYNGTNFNRKVLTRVDPQVSFDWTNRSPASGIGKSYYSIRWTGTLLAPVSGTYIFSANVDDGIRVWVGNRKIIDAWSLHDSDRFRGSVTLEAGKYYELKIDYFNDMLGGVIELLWHRPDETDKGVPLRDAAGKSLSDPTIYRPITAQYLYQMRPAPPVSAIVLPKPTVVMKPQVKPKPKLPVQPPKPVMAVTPPVIVPTAQKEKPASAPALPVRMPNATGVKTILFGQSTYAILPASVAELDTVIQVLRQQPTLRIDITGHTDDVGDPRLNQSLSEYRAKVVMHYLVRHGIADNRMTTRGYGGSKPVYSNDTEVNRARNRRVELEIK
jgi:outer membrane protein OmpA-like peptidoglycan-associated protein